MYSVVGGFLRCKSTTEMDKGKFQCAKEYGGLNKGRIKTEIPGDGLFGYRSGYGFTRGELDPNEVLKKTQTNKKTVQHLSILRAKERLRSACP